MSLLKFITAGNVDDGKSTLLGRLMFDTGKIPHDITELLRSQQTEQTEINLAFITDGLKREREAGITIDVSYKYFSSNKRKYIVIDAPGHFEFTRNLFTGASNAHAMFILVDVCLGVTAQTRLHLLIAAMLRIRHIYVCINKMDLVKYDQTLFTSIEEELLLFAQQNGIELSGFIPVSALEGDNIVKKSTNMPWYKEKTLFSILETIKLSEPNDGTRIQIQYSIQQAEEWIHFAHVISGNLSKDSELYTSSSSFRLNTLYVSGRPAKHAKQDQPVSFTTTQQQKLKRGTYLVTDDNYPLEVKKSIAILFCLVHEGIETGNAYILRNGSKKIKATILKTDHCINLTDGSKNKAVSNIGMNQIGQVMFEFEEPIMVDTADTSFETSKFILIDQQTKNTVAAGYFSSTTD